MSKRCINCGAELPDHAKFCNKCGATVPEQNSALFCPKCGAKLESGTKFCGSCGTPIGGAADTTSAGTGTYTQDQTGKPQPITDFSMVRPKKKNWTKVLAGIGIVVVILFVIGILSEDILRAFRRICALRSRRGRWPMRTTNWTAFAQQSHTI